MNALDLINYQTELANTAHQREVADLKAAGLNPVLSASGSGAETPNIMQAIGSVSKSSSAKSIAAAGRANPVNKALDVAETAVETSALSNMWNTLTSNRRDYPRLVRTGISFGQLASDLLNPLLNSARQTMSASRDAFGNLVTASTPTGGTASYRSTHLAHVNRNRHASDD